jgi:hypothetical protein
MAAFLGFWRRRPDLNRGWRFCRFNGVVNRVVSCWSLVCPASPFLPRVRAVLDSFGLRCRCLRHLAIVSLNVGTVLSAVNRAAPARGSARCAFARLQMGSLRHRTRRPISFPFSSTRGVSVLSHSHSHLIAGRAFRSRDGMCGLADRWRSTATATVSACSGLGRAHGPTVRTGRCQRRDARCRRRIRSVRRAFAASCGTRDRCESSPSPYPSRSGDLLFRSDVRTRAHRYPNASLYTLP